MEFDAFELRLFYVDDLVKFCSLALKLLLLRLLQFSLASDSLQGELGHEPDILALRVYNHEFSIQTVN